MLQELNCVARKTPFDGAILGFSHERAYQCPQFKSYVYARRILEEDPLAQETPGRDGAFVKVGLTDALQNTPPLDYYQSIKHLIPDNFYAVFTGTVNGQKKVLVAKAGRILAFDPPPNPFAKN